MIHHFSGRTANALWKNSFKAVLNSPEQESRAGTTKELLHVALSIENPEQRWITFRFPVINPAFAIAEVIWILNGRNDLSFLYHWNKNYSDYAGASPRLHGAYGFRLTKHFSFNQLARAYYVLKNNPDSRQVLLQIWDPRIDLPSRSGAAKSKDIPCNLISLVKVRNSKLEWMQILRSNDIFRGLPYNIIQFTTLQEILAGWLRLRVGTYNQISDSLHLYLHDLKSIRLVHRTQKKNTDSLALPYRESLAAFKTMEKLCCKLMTTSTSSEIGALLKNYHLPVAHKNLFLVLSAEQARRNGMGPLSRDIISRCCNPALRDIWEIWFLSKQEKMQEQVDTSIFRQKTTAKKNKQELPCHS